MLLKPASLPGAACNSESHVSFRMCCIVLKGKVNYFVLLSFFLHSSRIKDLGKSSLHAKLKFSMKLFSLILSICLGPISLTFTLVLNTQLPLLPKISQAS